MQALVKCGAGVNIKAKDGFTLLHMVTKMVGFDTRRSLQFYEKEKAKGISFNCLKLLLEHGAEVKAKTNNGLSPVQFMAKSGLFLCSTT